MPISPLSLNDSIEGEILCASIFSPCIIIDAVNPSLILKSSLDTYSSILNVRVSFYAIEEI